MTAETLRRATALMRERAEAATPGPWRDCPMGSEGSIVQAGGNTILTARKPATCREFADATHIASWHPAVALAVADLLDSVVRMTEWRSQPETHADCDDDCDVVRALNVAEMYLGEAPWTCEHGVVRGEGCDEYGCGSGFQSFRPERGDA